MNKTYIAIDLKSFYASVECVERSLDPLTTNLVVADSSRTEKTICLAVSPSLKSYGLKGRSRLFEVVQKINEINRVRKYKNKSKPFTSKSYNDTELKSNPSLELSYIVATPRMALYEKYSSKIYSIYLQYVSKEDIHVYSIDEVFIDATSYLKTYKTNAHDFTMTLVKEVLSKTGITATAGIGTNLYLSKIAMDIVAKKIPADENGVRIAELDEQKYRKELWSHKPITDFWRLGKGIATRLEKNHIYTMGDIARLSTYNEELLYKIFGINAELIIDHAWGYEPCTIKEIKNYKPLANSISEGQVLKCPYNYEKMQIIVREMAEVLSLNLVEKRLITNQIVLTVGYDNENLLDAKIKEYYKGEIILDRYGREVPKYAHGTENLSRYTSSTMLIADASMKLFERIVDKNLLFRRISICANNVVYENENLENYAEQIDIFNVDKIDKQDEMLKKERELQKATLKIKDKFGKNAILKGMNFKAGATTKERNEQIGGHKA